MGNKSFMLVLVLFFFCYFILCTLAVPSSRSLINQNKQDPSTQSLLSDQGNIDLVENKRNIQQGRMIIELTDYPGTGANKNHDPKDPGNTD